MSRKVLAWVAIAAVAHMAIASASFFAMYRAEASRLRVFSALVRPLIFSDVSVYREYADLMVSGRVPYRDFAIEYPPLAPVFFLLPRLFTARRSAYFALFACEMFVVHSLLVGAVARRVEETEGDAAVPSRLAWMTAGVFGSAPFLMGRFDPVPALLGFLAACLIYGNRPKLGGVLAGVGVLVKIFPGVTALPAFVLEVFDRPRRRPGAVWAFVGTMAAGVAAWLLVGGAGVMRAIRYHSDRGIELGSLSAGVLALIGRLSGAPIRSALDLASKSQNVSWEPWSGYASRLALPCQAAMLGLVAVGYLRGGRRDPFRFAGAAVLAFAIGGKVLSPQYLLWVLPFVTVLTGRAGALGRPLFVFASLLTMILYPWTFYSLCSLEIGAVLLLNLRNLALLWLLGVMIAGPHPEPAAGDPQAAGRPMIGDEPLAGVALVAGAAEVGPP